MTTIFSKDMNTNTMNPIFKENIKPALTAFVLCVSALLSGCVNTAAVDKVAAEKRGISSESPDKFVQKQTENSYGGDIQDIIAQNADKTVDLTVLNANMTYAQVYEMYQKPNEYIGCHIIANGSYQSEEYNGMIYHAVLVKDALACCSQGIEFDLVNDNSYPSVDEDIIVEGTFGCYAEGKNIYLCILDAEWKENITEKSDEKEKE